jgi:hypothetical protein
LPVAEDGGPGSLQAGGFRGGGAGPTSGINVGGLAGFWGESGGRGYVNATGTTTGGAGGNGGNAFGPISGAAALNLTGVKAESLLRTQGRIAGETMGFMRLDRQPINIQHKPTGTPDTNGWAFGILGQLYQVKGNPPGVDNVLNGYFWADTLTGGGRDNYVAAEYEIIQIADTLYSQPYTLFGAAEGVWAVLTTQLEWSYDDGGNTENGAIFAMRRTAATGGTGEPMTMGWLQTEHSDNS